eukprot:scaffold8094_cov286-Pinguiococcus_pyrenoidosus.AAC.1
MSLPRPLLHASAVELMRRPREEDMRRLRQLSRRQTTLQPAAGSCHWLPGSGITIREGHDGLVEGGLVWGHQVQNLRERVLLVTGLRQHVVDTSSRDTSSLSHSRQQVCRYYVEDQVVIGTAQRQDNVQQPQQVYFFTPRLGGTHEGPRDETTRFLDLRLLKKP